MKTRIYTMLLVFGGLLFQQSNSFAGDAIFTLGDQWIGNQTGSQLDGFDVIRISSYKDTSVFRAVTDTLNKKLMIAIAEPHAQRDAIDYAQTVLDSFNVHDGGPLKRWESLVTDLKNGNIPLDSVMYYLEIK